MRHQPSFARGTAPATPPKSPGIRPALFYGMFAVLLTGNALTATAFLLAPDISRLYNGQTEQVVEAYEDRVAQLRVEVDRLHSRSFAQTGDINLQLQELSQQQEVLTEQHQLVQVLVDKAGELGIDTATLPAEKPSGDAADAGPVLPSGNPDIDATAQALDRMMGETQTAMTAIADAATQRTQGIVSELSGIGINVALPDGDLDGVGGPLLPPQAGEPDSPMVEDANAVMSALVRYKAARDSIASAPVHMPLTGQYRQSSGFGNRTDPFSGGRAFHAGLDFAAPSGSIVSAAADGTVTFVGTMSGYGNAVEITHANGLVTRYGHLSAFLSEVGQVVHTGTPIAKVGSTGRSTGPHLHFEVRRNNAAIDPANFLKAGKRLSALLG
ncbi:MAG: family metallopeptidase [Devosia sp.]|uniref:M23 family metallopeptidase n=1 Tax=Devosia sp. TaxID=1871048 RepID=UPI00261ED195|nr:M23 family metallopeptidase [Devosia sp.]MDB5527277.1 family metallopeptidase [Devosia sp.]